MKRMPKSLVLALGRQELLGEDPGAVARVPGAGGLLEVLEVEKDIRDAAEVFGKILRAASWFGGEEIVEL